MNSDTTSTGRRTGAFARNVGQAFQPDVVTPG
jgi:hypothetical protein